MRAAAAIALLALGCGAAAVRYDGRITVKCDDANAAVYVDDHLMGRAAETAAKPVEVTSGAHRIEVRAEGKLTAYRDVVLPENGRATVEVTLHPDLDQAAP